MGKVITYGVGGYDQSKPNGNIIDVQEVDDASE
jgi:hypothetical protein